MRLCHDPVSLFEVNLCIMVYHAEPTSLRLRSTKMAECYNVTCAKIIYVNGSDFIDENGDLLYLNTVI